MPGISIRSKLAIMPGISIRSYRPQDWYIGKIPIPFARPVNGLESKTDTGGQSI